MGRDRQAFTADGEPITIHEHIWVMVSVTLHPGAESKRPVLGASVVWRCTKRNCKGEVATVKEELEFEGRN